MLLRMRQGVMCCLHDFFCCNMRCPTGALDFDDDDELNACPPTVEEPSMSSSRNQKQKIKLGNKAVEMKVGTY